MNKLLLSAALAAVATCSALAPRSASAVDGTITITGKVVSSTCTINNAANPASIAVTLPTVSVSSLNTVGSVAGRTPFNIALSGCDKTAAKASAYFEPGPNISTIGNLKNSPAAGSAVGVEVQLLNSDASTIKLGAQGDAAAQNSAAVTLASNAGTLSYYAQYYAAAAVTAGAVSTNVQFTMQYQ